ncbi:MAG: DnaB-like helicase C-terminal domain-containing protein [Candidatus Gastranaerophilaceae bacterium]
MLDKNLLQDVWDNLENQNKTFFQTGFEDLDCILSIQEKKGALITIGARPAMGKTTFMLSILENILSKNKKCLYFSLDTLKEQLITRLLFQISETNFMKFKYFNYIEENDWRNLSEAMNKLLKWNLRIDDNSGIKTEEIETAIKEFHPDVVFIDYFQLMERKRKQDQYTQSEEIIIDLKRIAKEYGVVIIVACSY